MRESEGEKGNLQGLLNTFASVVGKHRRNVASILRK